MNPQCKCGGSVMEIKTPIQYDTTADRYGVIHRTTMAVDTHFVCRGCGKESARARTMLEAVANWGRDMRYRIQYASKHSDDWESFITQYEHIAKARADMAYMRNRRENYVFQFRIVDQNGKVVE